MGCGTRRCRFFWWAVVPLAFSLICWLAGGAPVGAEVQVADEVEAAFNARDYETALAVGMPIYRRIALQHPQDSAVHTFAVRLAVIVSCAREAETLLGQLARRGGAGVSSPNAGAMDRAEALYAEYSVYRSPMEGMPSALDQQTKQLLSRLLVASRRQKDIRLLEIQRALTGTTLQSLGNQVVSAYLCSTREPKDLLEDSSYWPAELQPMRVLSNAADFLLSIGEQGGTLAILSGVAHASSDRKEASDSLFRVGKLSVEMGRHADAVAAYRSVVSDYADTPAAPKAQYELIVLLGDVWKNYPSAVAECRQLLSRFPRSPQASRAQFLMGQYLYLDGKYEDAVEAFRTYQRDYPNSELQVHSELLLGLGLIGARKNEEAVGVLRELVRQHPEHQFAERAQYLIGYSFLTEQRYTEARREFQKQLDLYPTGQYSDRAQQFVDRLSKVTTQ